MSDKRKHGIQNISCLEFAKRLEADRYSAAGRARTIVTRAAWATSVKDHAYELIDRKFGKKTVDSKVKELVETAQKLEESGELKVYTASAALPPPVQPPPPAQPPPFITSAMLMDLDMRELAIIDRMRAHALPPPPFVPMPPKFLNGANTRS